MSKMPSVPMRFLTKLMGDDVSLCKNFIQSEAKNAKLEELDI